MGLDLTAIRNFITLGFACLAAGAGTSPPSGGWSVVTVEYYDVSGRTVEEIRAAGRRFGPLDPNTGERVIGYTAWHLDWDAPGDPEGPCRLDQAWVTLDVTVTLPRLVESEKTPSALVERWRPFVAAVRAHEMGHARIAEAGRAAMLRAIRRADCATAPKVASEAAAALQRHSDAYDRATRHGLNDGVHFP